MNMTEAISVPKKLDQEPNNSNNHIHTLKQHVDSYQSAYEAGLASGKEAGYRRGYREGFSDCRQLGNPTPGEAETSHTSADASKVATANCASRFTVARSFANTHPACATQETQRDSRCRNPDVA